MTADPGLSREHFDTYMHTYPSPRPLPGRKFEMFAREAWVRVIDMSPQKWTSLISG